jgi:hypothetical protein
MRRLQIGSRLLVAIHVIGAEVGFILLVLFGFPLICWTIYSMEIERY